MLGKGRLHGRYSRFYAGIHPRGCSVNSEWLTPQSISYLAECLQYCKNPEMLEDLRAIAPAEALRQASQRLSQRKRKQIKVWVQQLNSAREVAA
jgi:uncharacterized membrane protein